MGTRWSWREERDADIHDLLRPAARASASTTRLAKHASARMTRRPAFSSAAPVTDPPFGGVFPSPLSSSSPFLRRPPPTQSPSRLTLPLLSPCFSSKEGRSVSGGVGGGSEGRRMTRVCGRIEGDGGGPADLVCFLPSDHHLASATGPSSSSVPRLFALCPFASAKVSSKLEGAGSNKA